MQQFAVFCVANASTAVGGDPGPRSHVDRTRARPLRAMLLVHGAGSETLSDRGASRRLGAGRGDRVVLDERLVRGVEVILPLGGCRIEQKRARINWVARRRRLQRALGGLDLAALQQ